MSIKNLILALLISALVPVAAWADVGKFPAPKGFVSDFAGVVSQPDAAELDGFLKDLEARTTAEVAVVTVPDINGYTDIDEYAVELFKAWGIGKKGQDNGVLIVLAMKEKKARIEVGYGLEGAITDGTAGEIIREVMAPHFREGQYGQGLMAGARAVAERIPPGGVKPPSKTSKIHFSTVLFFLFIMLVMSQMFFPGGMLSSRGRGTGRPFIGPFGGGFGGGFGGFGGGGGGFGGGFGGFGGGGSGGGGASGGW